MHFTEVGVFSQPVVLLYIDIYRVVAAPRGPDIGIPDALQVGRYTGCARAGDEQVTSVLEIEYFQIKVLFTSGIAL